MKKALVVIDMQKDFVDGSLANPMAQEIVTPIAEYVKNFEGDVFATRDTHQENYLESSEGKKLPVVHCVHGTPGWEIVSKIAQALEDKNAKIIDKPTFGYMDWNFMQAYEEVTLIGTCTDICVVSNALILKAVCPDVAVQVIGELCAGTTKENHESALTVMACCQIDVK